MNKKAFSMVVMLLASVLMIGIQPMSTKAVGVPTIAILPSPQTFNNPPIPTTFTVNCTLSNMGAPDLYGVDIEVGWNTSWIQYVSHTMTIPVETYPHGILHSPILPIADLVNESDAGFNGTAPGTDYWLAQATMGGAAFVGTGTAFLMTFKIIYVPPVGAPDLHTFINFTYVKCVNSTGDEFAVVWVPGEVIIKPPTHIYPPIPLLKVLPTDYYGVLNSPFDVSIVLMGADHGDLDPEWDVAGIDFKLTYNSSLIAGYNATCDPDGTIATFWPGGIWTIENGTDDVTGLAWIAFLGLPNATGSHFPIHGQIRVAAIHFKCIYQQVPPPFIGPTCPLNINESQIASFPHPERLYDPWDGSDFAVLLDHNVENGTYHAPVLFATGVDIYTNYPDYVNGTGIGNPSDMLWPQKGFYVYAHVLFNLWPEQQKDVAFELIDPYGYVRAIYYNRTDSNGYCWVFIRFPWPCTDPEHEFGYDSNGMPTPWTIVATVDIACKVYNDTMPFKYDYRVRIFKTTLDKVTYNHLEVITVTIDYGTVSLQKFWALFTVTGTDVTGVPFWFDYAWVLVGGAQPWCTMLNGTVTLTLYIPKYARAGFPATVYVGVLSNWPLYGGDAYYPTRSPETIQTFSIYPY